MEENARGGEREEPEVGRGGGGRERLAARCEGDPRPGWSSSPGDGAHRWQRHETTDGATWPQAPGPGLCLMQCAPALAPLTLEASGAGRGGRQLVVPPSSWGPEAQSWWGFGGAPRDGTGQSHAGWVPPTRVPSSQRPRPWATLAPARHSTAPPPPVQMPRRSTRAACCSQTCRPASQVGWAAQPCFWPLCPGGPGAVGSRCPPKPSPAAG